MIVSQVITSDNKLSSGLSWCHEMIIITWVFVYIMELLGITNFECIT